MDLTTILLLGIVALLGGFIDAIAGGGGMLVMPALLSIGMPPHLVVGTNKLVGTFGTLSASVTFIRKGLFQPALWWAMSFGTLVGALLGAVLIYLMYKLLLRLPRHLRLDELRPARRHAANIAAQEEETQKQ